MLNETVEKNSILVNDNDGEKIHPWRICPWDDAVAEYKGILGGIIEGKNPDPKKEMSIFRNFHRQLSEQ